MKFSFEGRDGWYQACLLHLPYRAIEDVLCVSTQIGCPFDCRFCEVGIDPFKRNLSSDEILEQVGAARSDPWWKNHGPAFEIAAMGTGEPLLVLGELLNAIAAVKELDPELASLNVSTIGIPQRIREYATSSVQGIRFSLQLSLHGSTDVQRARIMPRASAYPIEEVLASARFFVDMQQRPVQVNYLLLDGANDSAEDAERLIRLLDRNYFAVKISVLNPVSTASFLPSSPQRLRSFLTVLEDAGLSARIFASVGTDVGAGCGQFGNYLASNTV